LHASYAFDYTVVRNSVIEVLMFIRSDRFSNRIVLVVGLLVGLFAQLLPLTADAAVGFQNAYLRLDRMKINTTTGGTVCAKPASTATEGKVLVTFPSSYTVNSTAGNWTVTTSPIPAGATAWPSITTASSVSGQVVTFGSGDLTVGTMYCFNFVDTNTLTTAAGAANSQQASIATQTSGSVAIDTTLIALANIADDQIVVSAVVPPSFTFTLGGNTDSFTTNLDPSSVVSTTGKTVTILTKAKGGWIAWAKDSQQGLRSATAGYTIPAAGTINGATSTLSSGTEGYVLDVDLTTDAAGGCTLALDAEYDGSGSNSGGTLTANFEPLAACTTGTANSDVITLTERAAISGATPASTDYSDIITVVGAGNF
jgi:hypothetical protein